MDAVEALDMERLHCEDNADRMLVDKARQGDSAAFGELVRRHRARAFGWASSITQDHYLADDIVQEALIRAS